MLIQLFKTITGDLGMLQRQCLRVTNRNLRILNVVNLTFNLGVGSCDFFLNNIHQGRAVYQPMAPDDSL